MGKGNTKVTLAYRWALPPQTAREECRNGGNVNDLFTLPVHGSALPFPFSLPRQPLPSLSRITAPSPSSLPSPQIFPSFILYFFALTLVIHSNVVSLPLLHSIPSLSKQSSSECGRGSWNTRGREWAVRHSLLTLNRQTDDRPLRIPCIAGVLSAPQSSPTWKILFFISPRCNLPVGFR